MYIYRKPQRKNTSHITRMAQFVFCLWLLLVSSLSCAGITSSEEKMAEEWGIKILSLRHTAADYMLDFRFRIVDGKKVQQIMNRKIKPYLIVERTGQKLQVPISTKLGPLRQAKTFAKADRNYFMFFANPGRLVKKNDKVTIVIGDFKVEHLVVE